MSIRETLELDLSQGIDAIAQLGQTLASTLITAENLGEAINSAIAGLSNIEVAPLQLTADPTGILDSIANIEIPPLFVPLTADPTDLISAIADIIDSVAGTPFVATLQLDTGDVAAEAESVRESILQSLGSLDVAITVSADTSQLEDISNQLQQISNITSITVPVDGDTTALTDSVAGATDALQGTTVTVTVDGDTGLLTADAQGAIDNVNSTIATVTVDGDTTPLLSAVDDAVAAVTASTPVVSVEADTSSLDASIGSAVDQITQSAIVSVFGDTSPLLGSASDAVGSVDGLAASVSVFGDASALIREALAAIDEINSSSATVTIVADTSQLQDLSALLTEISADSTITITVTADTSQLEELGALFAQVSSDTQVAISVTADVSALEDLNALLTQTSTDSTISVTVEVDTSALADVATAVDALQGSAVAVDVTADTTNLSSEVAAAVDEAQGAQVIVSVDADIVPFSLSVDESVAQAQAASVIITVEGDTIPFLLAVDDAVQVAETAAPVISVQADPSSAEAVFAGLTDALSSQTVSIPLTADPAALENEAISATANIDGLSSTVSILGDASELISTATNAIAAIENQTATVNLTSDATGVDGVLSQLTGLTNVEIPIQLVADPVNLFADIAAIVAQVEATPVVLQVQVDPSTQIDTSSITDQVTAAVDTAVTQTAPSPVDIPVNVDPAGLDALEGKIAELDSTPVDVQVNVDETPLEATSALITDLSSQLIVIRAEDQATPVLEAVQSFIESAKTDIQIGLDTSQAISQEADFAAQLASSLTVSPTVEGAEFLASLSTLSTEAVDLLSITSTPTADMSDYLAEINAAAEFGTGALSVTAILSAELDTAPIDAQVADIIDTVGSQSAAIPVDLDSTELLASLGADVDAVASAQAAVSIGVDDAEFFATIGADIAQVEAEGVVIPVTADTSSLDQGATSGRGNATKSVLEGVGAVNLLTHATTALKAATGAAQGEATAFTGVLGQISTGAAAAAGGITAAAAATGLLFEEGLKGVAATQRLNLVLGEQAEAVQNIDVGGLTGNINELALKVGTVTPNIQQATANLGFLAENSKFTSAQTKELIGNFSALALQAVAVKPQLGSVGDVMNSLVPALSRGGRFALQFGLALDSADINARALTETGKRTASQLTALEKAFAGAEIATEQLGNKIGTNFQKGSEQAAVQFAALKATITQNLINLGAPLVQPILDLFKEATPVITEFGKGLADVAKGIVAIAEPLASALLPAAKGFAEIAQVIGPVLSFIGTVLSHVPSPLLAAAAGFVATKVAISALVAILPSAITELEAFVALEAILGNPIALVGGALVGISAVFGLFGHSAKEATTQTSDLADQLVRTNDAAHTTAGTFENLAANIGDILTKNSDKSPLGDILTKDNEKLLTALRGSGLGIQELTKDLQRGDQGATDFAEHVVQVIPKAAEVLGGLGRKNGQSIDQLVHGLATGSQSIDDFRDHIRSLNEHIINGDETSFKRTTVEGVVSGVANATKAFADFQKAQEASAKTALFQASNSGQLTLAQEKEFDVLLLGNQRTADYLGLLNRVQRGIDDTTPGVEHSSQAFIVLGQAIADGIPITDSFVKGISERFGVAASAVEAFVQDSTAALAKFAQSLVSALPSVNSFFADFRANQVEAFNTLATTGNALAEAQKTFAEATTTGLQGQRDAIANAAEGIAKANQKLADARKDASTAGATATTQAQDAKDIENANKKVRTAQEGVTDATKTYNKAQESLSRAQSAAAETFAKAQRKVAEANAAFAAAFDPGNLTKKFQDELRSLLDFDKNINTLLAEKNTDLVQNLLQQGPVVGGALAEQFVKAGPKVAGAANTAAANVRKELQSLADEFSNPKFADKLPGAAQTIADTAAKTFGITLKNSGKDQSLVALEAILQVFGPNSPEFKKAVKDANLGGAGDAILNELFPPNRTSGLGGPLGKLLPGAKGVLNLQDALKAQTPSDVEGGSALDNFTKGITDAISKSINDGAKNAKPSANKIGSDIVEGLHDGLKTAAKGDKNPSDEITKIANDATDAANTALGIKSPSKVFKSIGEDVVAGFAEGLSGAGEVLGAAIDDSFQKVGLGAAFEASVFGQTLGEDIIDGIVAGMKLVDPALKKQMEKTLKDLEKQARKIIDAHSPSLLFADLGKDIALGIAFGIDTNADAIKDSTTSAITGAHTAASTQARLTPALVSASVASAPTVGIPASGNLVIAPVSAQINGGNGIDEGTAAALKELANTLDKGVKATRPIQNTFNEKVDPLHVAADIQWKLSR